MENKKRFRSAYDYGDRTKGEHFDPVYRYEYVREDGKKVKNEINMEKEIDSVNYLTSQEMIERGENYVGTSEGFIDGRDLPDTLDGLLAYIQRIKDVSKQAEANPENNPDKKQD